MVLAQEGGGENGLASIGSRTEIIRELASFNTGPERDGGDILFGPGVIIQLPPGQDDVTQMILSISEEDIGWQVVERLATRFGWRLLDTVSGREWTPAGSSA